MFIINLINDNRRTEIHGTKEKLKSGNVVKGINVIDSFSFAALPSNAGFNSIRDLKTHVTVWNTNKNRYEFMGRVLYSSSTMDEDGSIGKEAICESYFGFLCDSQQPYVEEQNWTVDGLLSHIVNEHNAQVERDKRFVIGQVDVTDPNDNLYLGIQRDNTWNVIQEKLIKKLGGEIRFRVVDGVIYLDYLKKIGTIRKTPIALSKNMKSITKEDDPTAYISRLIPYGCKLKDADGNDTEQRLDITSVNGGKNYIESPEAVAVYGIRYGIVEFDDVTDANNLMRKGQEYLAKNNRVQRKYTITALDLSLLGIDIDDLDVHDYYPILNPLLNIDDIARIIKKNVNVVEETKSTIEVGDNFKTLSDIQLESMKDAMTKLESTKNELKDFVSGSMSGVTDEIRETILEQNTTVINDCTQILMSALKSYTEVGNFESFKETVEAQLRILADEISMTFTKSIEETNKVNNDLQSKYNTITKYFTFDIDGLKIGQSDSPFTVVLDNDLYSMQVNGVPVLWLDPDGKSNIPELKVTKLFDLFGYHISMDERGRVNCAWQNAVAPSPDVPNVDNTIYLHDAIGNALYTKDGMKLAVAN